MWAGNAAADSRGGSFTQGRASLLSGTVDRATDPADSRSGRALPLLAMPLPSRSASCCAPTTPSMWCSSSIRLQSQDGAVRQLRKMQSPLLNLCQVLPHAKLPYVCACILLYFLSSYCTRYTNEIEVHIDCKLKGVLYDHKISIFMCDVRCDAVEL